MPKDTDETTTTTTADPVTVAAAQTAATVAALQAEPEDTTARPVVVYYDAYAEPDELHPAGVLAGSIFESPTPEVAYQFHPKARILRYADGTAYSARKAKREIREASDT